MDCATLERDIWRFVDRELSARRMADISAHLRDCALCRELHETRCREARAYRAAFDETPFGDAFVERFRSRLVVESSDSGPDGRRASSRAFGTRELSRRLTLVAIVFVVPILTFVVLRRMSPEVETLGTFGMASLSGQDLGDPRASRRNWAKYRVEGGKNFETVSGFQNYALRPGTEFEVAPAGELAVRIGDPRREPSARIVVYGSAFVRFPSTSTTSRFRARLEVGRLSADVEPRDASESFTIETPDAVFRVIGTRFTIDVFNGETRLSVDEGEVELTALASGVTSRAEAGSTWRVVSGASGRPEPVDPSAAPAPIPARAAPEPDAAARAGADSSRSDAAGDGSGRSPDPGVETPADASAGDDDAAVPVPVPGDLDLPPRRVPIEGLDSPVGRDR